MALFDERQVKQFYLQQPSGTKMGDPLATALSNIAESISMGLESYTKNKQIAVERELEEAKRLDEQKEKDERKRQEALAEWEAMQAAQAEKRAQMTQADAISSLLINEESMANLTPEQIIEVSIAMAKEGKNAAGVQSERERADRDERRVAALEESSAAKVKKDVASAAKTEEEVRSGNVGGRGSEMTDAEIKRAGAANAESLVSMWEEESGQKLTQKDFEELIKNARAKAAATDDPTERAIYTAEIDRYNEYMRAARVGTPGAPPINSGNLF